MKISDLLTSLKTTFKAVLTPEKAPLAPAMSWQPIRTIITEGYRLPAALCNQNVLVLGGPGSGMTRSFLMPNLLQMHGSYVVGSSDYSVLHECGNALATNEYEVTVFSMLCEQGIKCSRRYNPFAYIHSDSDIIRFVDALMASTTGHDSGRTDPFWYAAERTLLYALIGYVWYVAVPEERNIGALLDIINAFQVEEDKYSDDFTSPIDLLFNEVEKEVPHNFAVNQYKKFKHATGRAARSIVISCAVRLAAFDTKEARELLSRDELALDKLGTSHMALFIIASPTDAFARAVTSLLYAQLFDSLLKHEDFRLPMPVRFLLDDMSVNYLPKKFEATLASMKGRNIYVSLLLQSIVQLENAFPKVSEYIVNSFQTLLYMGGGRRLDNEFCRISGVEANQLVKLLSSIKLKRNTYAVLTYENDLVMMRKYDLKHHPNYFLIAEADPDNEYAFPRCVFNE